MKKVPESVRKRLRRERILKTIIVQLIILILCGYSMYLCRPVRTDEVKVISFYADAVESIYARGHSLKYILHNDIAYRVTMYWHFSYNKKDYNEKLITEFLTVSYLPNENSIINQNIIVDLRSDKTVFFSIEDYNKEKKEACIMLVIFFFFISLLMHGYFFILIDKLSFYVELFKMKKKGKIDISISDYQQKEKQLIKHKKRKKCK